MTKRESLWGKVPGYRVDLEPDPRRVRVRLSGVAIAETTRALLVRETRHAPVVYFPREDVHLERLEATAHRSYCPFKGEARYWTIRAGDRVAENAAWSYEDPFQQVAGLKDCVAFYEDRVEWEFS